MTLIKSISGIRGTIGGEPGKNLTPLDVVLYSSAYAEWLKQKNNNSNNLTIVVGRDGRISGQFIHQLVINTLIATGINVIDIGLATTPTTELAVQEANANGGIIITASHNPIDWNALKLLNQYGEFVSDEDGKTIIKISENYKINFSTIHKIGKVVKKDFLKNHINKILSLNIVDKDSIKKANFKIVVDCINSVGAIAVPELLKQLEVNNIILINDTIDGNFRHNPEPLDEHLEEIKQKVVETNSHLGIVVDPDVDRLAFICEDGKMFGEEYTLVAIADYVLQHYKGKPVVTNLSTTKALDEVAFKYGSTCYRSPVGEANVVKLMKEKKAIIGGEGNGGVILPQIHYGRDALVGIALFLSYLAKSNLTISQLRKKYPDYYFIKHKINLKDYNQFHKLKENLINLLPYKSFNDSDGIRLDFENSWLHCRPSNTEPIIRLYIEANTKNQAEELLKKVESLI
jgi:phosphomannomutase